MPEITRFDRREVLVTLAIGAAAGLGSGLLGVGGGIVMVPLLTGFLSFSQRKALATSLAALMVIAVGGLLRFSMDGEVDATAGLLLAAGAVVGVPIGTKVMLNTAEPVLTILFGVLLFGVGVGLLWP